MSRHRKYTERLGTKLLRQLAEGKSLREICDNPRMPHRSTICRWLADRPDFRRSYLEARQVGALLLFDDLLAISDDTSDDFKAEVQPDGSTRMVADHEHIHRSKLRLDTRKFILAKMWPRVFGEQKYLEVTDGSVLGSPAKRLDDLELARRIAWTLTNAARKVDESANNVAHLRAPPRLIEGGSSV